MLAIVLGHFFHYARDLPLAEDWNLVAALTGNEPNLGGWLWSQNNEHRLPLPRLVMLALLRATDGDFRSGMILNIALVALLAAAMIEAARRVRGGRTRYTDAFFPILLLHVGDWQNLLWSWQLSFVLSVVIVCVALLAIVLRPGLDAPGPAAATGAALILAPLTGGTGLLFLPPLMLWAGWRGWRLARAGESPLQRQAGAILIGAVVLTLTIIAIYLVGYRRPDWVPENPGLWKSLITAVQFQTFGLGPAVRTAWSFWIPVALLVLLAATVRVIRLLRPQIGTVAGRGVRAWGLLAGLASVAGFAAGMGWGRAAVISVYNGWPDRYVLLAAPAFCLAYFAWELPGREWAGRLGRGVLFGLVILLLPLNTVFGREYGHWYVTGMDRVIRDIRSGIPRDDLASRHLKFLIHWWDPPKLAANMQMLHDQGIGPLARLIVTEDSTPPAGLLDTLTLRYRMEEAGAVNLVWWTDAAFRIPPSLRPPGTTLGSQGIALSTPMRREGGAFSAILQIPRGMSLQYGFNITARNDLDTLSGVWDGTRRYEGGSGRGAVVLDAKPGVTLLTNPLRGNDTVLAKQTVRYGPTDARRVRVVWGIDGWQRLPNSLYPPRTRTVSRLMVTPMQRDNGMFTATLPVPVGHRLNFAFQLDRADRAGVGDNNFGQNYAVIAGADSTPLIKPRLTVAAGSRLTTVWYTGIPALLLVAALAVLSEGMGRRFYRSDEPGRPKV
jgi:hypothetical protein